MPKKSNDRRVNRTHRRLHDALMSLIHEKGFDAVTVQEILDRADVGRSTFYAHFMNKTDLLLGNLKAESFQILPEEGSAEIPSVAWIFVHAGENLALYRALSGTEAMPHVYRNFNEGLQRNWRKLLKNMRAAGRQIALPEKAVAAYLSHALIGLLVWWLDNRMPHSPEEMLSLIHI